jgi:hypothetical protein
MVRIIHGEHGGETGVQALAFVAANDNDGHWIWCDY